MKHRHRHLPGLRSSICAGIFWLCLAAFVHGAPVSRSPSLGDDFTAGVAADVFRQGATEQKPIALLFYARNCVWSRELMTGVLADPGIRGTLDGFAYREIDAGVDLALAAEYRVRTTPVLVILTPDGREIFRHQGIPTPRELLATLHAARTGDMPANFGESDESLAAWGRALTTGTIPLPSEEQEWMRLFRWTPLPEAQSDLRELLRNAKPELANRLVEQLAHSRLAMRLGAMEILELWAGEDFGFDPWETDATVTEPAIADWKAWAANPARERSEQASPPGDEDFLRARLVEVAYDTGGTGRRAWNALLREHADVLVPMVDRMLAEAPRLDRDGRSRLEELRLRKVLDAAGAPGAAAAARRLVHGGTDVRAQVLESLATRGDVVWPVVEPFFTAPDPLLRETAFDVAFRSSPDRMMARAEALLLEESDANVQFVILRRIASRQDAANAPLLLRFLDHENEDLVIASLEGIGRLNEAANVWADRQLGLLQDPRWRVRVAALGAMRTAKDKAAENAVIALLDDDDEFVRATAVQTVARLKLRGSSDLLAKIFASDPASRPAVISAFSAMEVSIPDAVVKQAMGVEKTEILGMLSVLRDADRHTESFVWACIQHPDPDISCAGISHVASRGMAHAHNLKMLARVLANADEVRRRAFVNAASFDDYTLLRALRDDRNSMFDDTDPELRTAIETLRAQLNKLYQSEQNPELRRLTGILLLGLKDDTAAEYLEAHFDELTPPEVMKLASHIQFLDSARYESLVTRLVAADLAVGREAVLAAFTSGQNVSGVRLTLERMFESSQRLPAEDYRSGISHLWTARDADWVRELISPWLQVDAPEDKAHLALWVASEAGSITDFRDEIAPLLQSDSPQRRAAAIKALGGGILKLSPEQIVNIIDTADPETLVAVLEALTEGGNAHVFFSGAAQATAMDPELQAAVTRHLNHPVDDVAWAAGEVLIVNMVPFDPSRIIGIQQPEYVWYRPMSALQSQLYSPNPSIPKEFAAFLPKFKRLGDLPSEIVTYFRDLGVDVDTILADQVPDPSVSVDTPAPVRTRPATRENESLPPTFAETTRTPVELVYFVRPGCADCDRVHQMLDRVRENFPELEVVELNINKNDSMEINEALSARFRVPESQRLLAPSLFAGGGFLVRDDITEDRIAQLILRSRGADESLLASVDAQRGDASGAIAERYENIRLELIVVAGLLDGLNPCAFATIIFLLSYLQVARKPRREMLQIGAAYILGVFAAYFTLGLGLVEVVTRLGFLQAAGRMLNFAMAAFAIVVAFLSVRDGLRCLKGQMADMTLQLPDALKSRIHGVIRGSVRHRHFVLLAFGVGVIISVLELACTGQVYAPTILYMLQSGRTEATGYLALYNLAFVLPLTVVFILAYFGLTSAMLTTFLKRHAALVKFATALLFIALAAVLVASA